MDRAEFFDQVKSRIKEYLPKEFEPMELVVQEFDIEGEKRVGFTFIEPEGKRVPVLDLEEACQSVLNGADSEDILRMVAKAYQVIWEQQEIPMVIMDEGEFKKNLHIAVLNFSTHRKILAKTPYLKVNDLAVIPMVKLSEGTSIPLSLQNAEDMQIPGDYLLAAAMKNHTSVLPPVMAEVTIETVQEMNPIDLGKTEYLRDDQVYIVSNWGRLYGSAVIADKQFLDLLGQKLGGCFYILPASQHDLMVVPEGMRLSPAQLKELMREMQKTVRDKDFLSDHVYRYDRKSKAVELFDGKCHAETVRSYTDGNER